MRRYRVVAVLTGKSTLGNFLITMSLPTDRRRPGRPRGGKVLAGREQLLDAAERAISSAGPQVTMEAIAAEANVTKPILYRGVGDRDALVAALSERFVERLNNAGKRAALAAEGPEEGLHQLIGAYLEVVDSQRSLFLFVTSGGSGDDAGRRSLELADRSAVPMAESLAAARSAAGLDPAVALTWAYGAIGALHYVTLWWLRDGQLNPGQLADQLTELLWSGLQGRVAAAI